jgi:hypothetical protein
MIMFIRNMFAICVVISLFSGCAPSDEAPVSTMIIDDGIDRIILDGSASKDPDGDPISFKWSSTTPGIVIEDASLSQAYFKIPEGNGMDATITLTVKDGGTSHSSEQIIPVPAWSKQRAYGLGLELNAEADNSAAYEWYLDQQNTGAFSLVNCGPTSVTMAIKWFNESFSKTPLDARNTYYPEGGWWYTNNMIDYLTNHGVTNYTVQLADMNVLKEEIDNGNIVILCLDMYYVTYSASDDHRYDKFYPTSSKEWGHFIVVKGYKKVDNKLYFEIYDPYSFGKKYDDLTLKGRNRYYRDTDLDIATHNWWPYAIVVTKEESQGGRKAVNTSAIKHMPGR